MRSNQIAVRLYLDCLDGLRVNKVLVGCYRYLEYLIEGVWWRIHRVNVNVTTEVDPQMLKYGDPVGQSGLCAIPVPYWKIPFTPGQTLHMFGSRSSDLHDLQGVHPHDLQGWVQNQAPIL